MATSPRRVAARWLSRVAEIKLEWVTQATLRDHIALIDRLQRNADPRRLARAQKQPIRVNDVMIGNGYKVEAQLSGSRGDTYYTRITFQPKPGHSCTCPDWKKKRYGPCKHVLALSIFWRDLAERTLGEKIQAEAEQMELHGW
jgi:uncharacterized Zn finger protein